MLYVAAIFTLLQDKVSIADVDLADDLLHLYSSDVEKIYDKKEITYNLHQSLHLTEGVKNWGQLHHTSTFNFEDQNGMLKRLIKGSKNVAVEISNSVDIINSLHCLKAYIEDREKETTLLLGAPVNINKIENEVQVYINDRLNQRNLSFKVYLRAKVNNYIFASKYYTRQTKRNNTLVHYGNNSFGQILCFLDFETGDMCCIIHCIKKKKGNHFNTDLHKLM
jgi:hypothetical protein